MQKIWYAKHDGYYHKCMSLIYTVLSEIEQIDRSYLPDKKYSIIEPAIEYIDNNCMYGDIDWKKFYLLHPERKGFDLRTE